MSTAGLCVDRGYATVARLDPAGQAVAVGTPVAVTGPVYDRLRAALEPPGACPPEVAAFLRRVLEPVAQIEALAAAVPPELLAAAEATPASRVAARESLAAALDLPVRRLVSTPLAAVSYVRHQGPPVSDPDRALVIEVDPAGVRATAYSIGSPATTVLTTVAVERPGGGRRDPADPVQVWEAWAPTADPEARSRADQVLRAAADSSRYADTVAYRSVTAGQAWDAYAPSGWLDPLSTRLRLAGAEPVRGPVVFVGAAADYVPARTAVLRALGREPGDPAVTPVDPRYAAAFGAALVAGSRVEPGDCFPYGLGLRTRRVVGGRLRPDRFVLVREAAVPTGTRQELYACGGDGSRVEMVVDRDPPARIPVEVWRAYGGPAVRLDIGHPPVPGRYHVGLQLDETGDAVLVLRPVPAGQAYRYRLPGLDTVVGSG